MINDDFACGENYEFGCAEHYDMIARILMLPKAIHNCAQRIIIHHSPTGDHNCRALRGSLPLA